MFDKNLEFGQAGESMISKWIRNKGWAVMPVYEKIFDTGKGPQVFMPNGEKIIAPDLFAWSFNGKALWVEAKRKTAFSWHRITKRWVTGIDQHHYEHYLSINSKTPWRVRLLFLQHGGHAKDSPKNSPSGLYAGWLSDLAEKINHRHKNWGKYGMVYWAEQSLKKVAELNEVITASKDAPL